MLSFALDDNIDTLPSGWIITFAISSYCATTLKLSYVLSSGLTIKEWRYYLMYLSTGRLK
jgi:hypothetical protein